ncbi:MAG: cytochrome P450 [Acidimicrobiia bacterium]|nr:cytochrome P450 [Acidimicrobiia bacterium]
MEIADINLLDLDRFTALEHHEMFATLRRDAPVFWHEEPDGPGFWNITRHADLVEVNREPELFSSEVGGISIFDPDPADDGMDMRGMQMLYTDPPKHTRYRRLVNKGFTPRMIGLIERYLEHRAVVIIDNVIELGSCDFVEDIAAELPLQAIAEIMGVPQEDRRLLFQWSNALIGIDDPEYGNEEGDHSDALTAAVELYGYVNQLAKDRASDPRDDIVTKLINAEIDGDRLSEMEFDMFMLLLTVAGNETTRNATSGGMYALLTHPDQWEALKADPDGLLETAVDEILRWSTPVLHFRRTATADTTVGGTRIRAGDKVVMWHISANRDETVFDDPFRFDVTRSPNDHISFGGGGAHYCLGANLARTELRLIFDEIIRRMPDMELAGEPSRLRSNFLAGIKHLPVTYPPGERVAPASVA